MRVQEQGGRDGGDQHVQMGGDRREVVADGEGGKEEPPMGADEIKKVEGLGTKGMCIRLVLLPKLVEMAILFMDIVAV